MTQVLALDDATVRRSGNEILSHVTWQVREGERWVILGRNGAGKTTLLQLAAARLHPTSGRVEVLEEALGAVDISELRPRIGLASAALAERIPRTESVLDVVRTASWGMTGRWREEYEEVDDDRALALLAAFGMAHLAHRTFGTLSEGERKRAQIARSLMADPELLLLDEPAAGLDLGGREELVAALSELAADPYSPVTVLVTHHVEEIPPHYTHVMLLREGAVQAAGPIETVLTAQNLTATFGVPIALTRTGERWTARASGDPRAARHGN